MSTPKVDQQSAYQRLWQVNEIKFHTTSFNRQIYKLWIQEQLRCVLGAFSRAGQSISNAHEKGQK